MVTAYHKVARGGHFALAHQIRIESAFGGEGCRASRAVDRARPEEISGLT